MKSGILLAAALLSAQAFAAGYEKTIMWGGRSAGLAGIATPWVDGSTALYFNPAGLVGDKAGQDISLNTSPTQSQFSGPINNNNTVERSDKQMSFPSGLIYGNSLNEKMGFGVGVYASGGSVASYQDAAFVSPATTVNVKTDLELIEIAAGYAYKVNENLKLGAAWRVSMAQADFAFVSRVNAVTEMNLEVNDLKDTNYTGFKLGAQYKVGDLTKLGFVYRSEVKLEADGKFGGNLNAAGTVFPIDETDATAKTTFPQAATLGVEHDLSENWKLFGEYAWTDYSKVDKVVVEGAVTRSGGTAVTSNPEVVQKWKDQHNLRIAAEYLGGALPFRFGYGYTSQVTNSDYARAAFTAPAPAHTITLGTGYNFNENMKLDGAFEYTNVKGDGNGTVAGTGGAGTDIRQGQYTTTAMALHLSFAYLF